MGEKPDICELEIFKMGVAVFEMTTTQKISAAGRD